MARDPDGCRETYRQLDGIESPLHLIREDDIKHGEIITIFGLFSVHVNLQISRRFKRVEI